MNKAGNLYSVVLGYVAYGKRGIKATQSFHTILPADDPEQALGRAIANAEDDENWYDDLILVHHDVGEITQEMMAIHYNPQLIINSQKPVVN